MMCASSFAVVERKRKEWVWDVKVDIKMQAVE